VTPPPSPTSCRDSSTTRSSPRPQVVPVRQRASDADRSRTEDQTLLEVHGRRNALNRSSGRTGERPSPGFIGSCRLDRREEAPDSEVGFVPPLWPPLPVEPPSLWAQSSAAWSAASCWRYSLAALEGGNAARASCIWRAASSALKNGSGPFAAHLRVRPATAAAAAATAHRFSALPGWP
jgi:hypothetical protein